MAANQVIVGVAQYNDSSTPIQARGTKQGSQLVDEYHGRYYEATYRKNAFNVASQAVATTTVGLATTYTGLCLANPIGSPVNLELGIVSLNQSVIQATQVEAFALAFGFNGTTNVTLTTPATPQSNFIGSGQVSSAKAATSATLPTAPLYGIFLQNTPSATTNGAGITVDLSGSIILPPGAYACFVTPAQASVAGMWFSFNWTEVPV